jgi:hypothetical protein
MCDVSWAVRVLHERRMRAFLIGCSPKLYAIICGFSLVV